MADFACSRAAHRSSVTPAPITAARRRRAARSLLVLAATVVVAAACSGPGTTARHGRGGRLPTTTLPVVDAGAIPLGVYAGPGNPSAVASFARDTGTAPSLASDYLPRGEGWADMTRQKSLRRFLQPWEDWGYRLVLGVPLIPTKDGRAKGTLAAGAAGRYDARFTTLARTLVSYGQADAVLRLGWEFNATWYAWAVTDAAQARQYAGYFRAVVQTMRAVPGTHFRFVWNPEPGPTPFDLSLAYPGNAYVDYVGLDLYDQVWGIPPARAWASYVNEANGLAWMASFATAHHKPAALPEWGATYRSDGHGLGDDPSFIADVAAWATTEHVAFTSYFAADVSDGSHDLTDGRFPLALRMFRREFGASTPVALASSPSAEATSR